MLSFERNPYRRKDEFETKWEEYLKDIKRMKIKREMEDLYTKDRQFYKTIRREDDPYSQFYMERRKHIPLLAQQKQRECEALEREESRRQDELKAKAKLEKKEEMHRRHHMMLVREMKAKKDELAKANLEKRAKRDERIKRAIQNCKAMHEDIQQLAIEWQEYMVEIEYVQSIEQEEETLPPKEESLEEEIHVLIQENSPHKILPITQMEVPKGLPPSKGDVINVDFVFGDSFNFLTKEENSRTNFFEEEENDSGIKGSKLYHIYLDKPMEIQITWLSRIGLYWPKLGYLGLINSIRAELVIFKLFGPDFNSLD